MAPLPAGSVSAAAHGASLSLSHIFAYILILIFIIGALLCFTIYVVSPLIHKYLEHRAILRRRQHYEAIAQEEREERLSYLWDSIGRFRFDSVHEDARYWGDQWKRMWARLEQNHRNNVEQQERIQSQAAEQQVEEFRKKWLAEEAERKQQFQRHVHRLRRERQDAERKQAAREAQQRRREAQREAEELQKRRRENILRQQAFERERAAYRAWKSVCCRLLRNKETMTTFPEPPKVMRCRSPDCAMQERELQACIHCIERMYRAVGPDLEKTLMNQKKQWDPELFDACPAEHKNQIMRKASELFLVICYLTEQERRNKGR